MRFGVLVLETPTVSTLTSSHATVFQIRPKYAYNQRSRGVPSRRKNYRGSLENRNTLFEKILCYVPRSRRIHGRRENKTKKTFFFILVCVLRFWVHGVSTLSISGRGRSEKAKCPRTTKTDIEVALKNMSPKRPGRYSTRK